MYDLGYKFGSENDSSFFYWNHEPLMTKRHKKICIFLIANIYTYIYISSTYLVQIKAFLYYQYDQK